MLAPTLLLSDVLFFKCTMVQSKGRAGRVQLLLDVHSNWKVSQRSHSLIISFFWKAGCSFPALKLTLDGFQRKAIAAPLLHQVAEPWLGPSLCSSIDHRRQLLTIHTWLLLTLAQIFQVHLFFHGFLIGISIQN